MIQKTTPALASGERLSREEFLRRWEALPGLKFAELVDGIVRMPSPVSRQHSRIHQAVNGWLARYAARTAGCESGCDATWRMLGDAPQPDADLRVLPEFGGQSRNEGDYPAGAPEFVVEVCASSAAHDLHAKQALYHAAGARECLAVLPLEREIRWRAWASAGYDLLPADADGIHRSRVFPGLWLDGAALLAGDLPGLFAALDQGLATPEHAAFVDMLRKRRGESS